METIVAPVTMREAAGLERMCEPVSFGAPFPKGKVWDLESMRLVDEKGDASPSAVSSLAFWSDNSLKWILVDALVNSAAGESKRYFLEQRAAKTAGDSAGASGGIEVEETPAEFIVRTGVVDFHLGRLHFHPFSAVASHASGAPLLEGSRVTLLDKEGRKKAACVEKSHVESRNALKVVLYFEGSFADKESCESGALRFRSRITFWSRKSFAAIEFTLWNPNAATHPNGLWDLGDDGSAFFQELVVELAAPRGSEYVAKYRLEADGPIDSGKDVCIYQDSSGGSNWKSRSHIDCDGRIPTSFQGYKVIEGDSVVGRGLRAEPIMSLSDGGRSLCVFLSYFWQSFPSLLHARENELRIGLFPKLFDGVFELQGGERKTRTFFVDFGSEAGDVSSAAWLRRPLEVHLDSDWCCECGVFPSLAPRRSEALKRFPYKEACELLDTAAKGENSFFARREIIDEYGWRNFGDVYADHENLLYKGEKPIISHYNNQYDLIGSFLKQFVLSGEQEWMTLAEQLASHVMDIDIYHTDKDRCEYNGGLFWHTDHYCDAATCTHRSYSRRNLNGKSPQSYGGGASCQHVYSQGLLNYYYMTGDPKAKEAVLELASFVLANINGPDRPLDLLKRMVKSAWKLLNSHRRLSEPQPFDLLEGPGRASGNVLSVLLDAFALTGSREYLLKAEFLIQRCVHPLEDLSQKKLHDVNTRWPYTIFLQSLGKYLDVKAQAAQFDGMYHYARRSLLHYAEWMMENEFPFLSRPELLDYPNLATRAATDVRKACVLILASKYCEKGLKEEYREKARFFFTNSIRDMLPMESKTFARPLAILMQNIDLPLSLAAETDEELSRREDEFEECVYPEPRSALYYLVSDNVRMLSQLSASFIRKSREG